MRKTVNEIKRMIEQAVTQNKEAELAARIVQQYTKTYHKSTYGKYH
ncbi:hypothetical protein [Halobacillus sp. K22]